MKYLIDCFTTDNGIRVIYETLPHFNSVSIGLWFGIGSAYEGKKDNGITHFIEHLLFKGTEKRSPRQIAVEVDAIGGQINAFTAKEYTCLYCKLLDEHIELGFDILSDMVINSLFDEAEIAKEKGVILEEICMYEDSPEDLVYENLAKNYFLNHPLALPIIGRTQNIRAFTRKQIVDFYHSYFTPNNLVISVAGKFNKERLKDLINKYFASWNVKGKQPVKKKVKDTGTGISYNKKDIEQIHLSFAFPGVELKSEAFYPSQVLNSILGGSMSSRLFQKVREDKGLVYSIYSFPLAYMAGGMFVISTSMKTDHITEVLKIVIEELETLRNKGISETELTMAKDHLKGNYIMGLESADSRMTALGMNKLLLDYVSSPAETIKKINDVSLAQVSSCIDMIFGAKKYTVSTVCSNDMTEEISNLFKESNYL